jgi:hypothetical protein
MFGNIVIHFIQRLVDRVSKRDEMSDDVDGYWGYAKDLEATAVLYHFAASHRDRPVEQGRWSRVSELKS